MSEEQESKIESYVFIGLTSILSLYILIGAYIHAKKWKYFHESLVILLIAGPFAYLMPRLMTNDAAEQEQYKISPKIQPNYIFNYLLPPIIMSAGFNMRKKFFFKNLGFIGMFGFVGTVFNFVLVTGAFYLLNNRLGVDVDHYNQYSPCLPHPGGTSRPSWSCRPLSLPPTRLHL